MELPIKEGNERVVGTGRMLEIVEQDFRIGEKIKTFEFARRAPGTRLIIPTANNTLLMSKEYRHEVSAWDYRLPGGKVFDSLDEYTSFLAAGNDILEVARTGAILEARQEVGISVTDMTHIATSTCGATVVWDLYYFVVDSYTSLSSQDLESGEHIDVVELSLDEVKEICLDGRMQEDRSAAVLLRYLHSRQII